MKPPYKPLGSFVHKQSNNHTSINLHYMNTGLVVVVVVKLDANEETHTNTDWLLCVCIWYVVFASPQIYWVAPILLLLRLLICRFMCVCCCCCQSTWFRVYLANWVAGWMACLLHSLCFCLRTNAVEESVEVDRLVYSICVCASNLLSVIVSMSPSWLLPGWMDVYHHQNVN